MTAAWAIDVHGLIKRFGPKTVVDGFSLQVPAGEVWGFLGPNGSGKTTTMRMLCGLLRPDGGEGRCLGLDIRRETEAIKRQVGYMTQRFSYYEDLSIRENLEFVARLHRLPNVAALVDEAIAGLGLTERQHQLAAALSGGWKQRLALAASLLHRPKLLLLDEPTAGVDPRARREFWEQIHRLAGEGVTVLVSTHYMDEAERCDRIVYLAFGHLLARGTIAEVLAETGLVTWIVSGSDVHDVLRDLADRPGIQTAMFGASLHVSSADHAALEAAIAPYRDRPTLQWTHAQASLEDAFIHLTAPFNDGRSR